MRRLILPLILLAAAGLVFSVAGLVVHIGRLQSRWRDEAAAAPLEPDPRLAGLRIPEFSLTDQNGRPQTEAILDGQVTVLDFTFTHCPFVCPMMNASMIQLQYELEGAPVRFLSISVDPVHDTPERLKEEAGRLSIDESRWTMLTGPQPQIDAILQDGLKFALMPDETRTIDLPDGSKMRNIIHPSKFLLIGPDRRVLGLYEHSLDEDIRNLKIRARLAADALRQRPSR